MLWHELKHYIVFPLLILIIALLHILIEKTMISHYIPESCVMIVLGMVIGFIFSQRIVGVGLDSILMTKNRFFYILLPPIVLDAGSRLVDKAFFNNVVVIAFLAVVGTIFNIAIVWAGLHMAGNTFSAFSLCNNMNGVEILMFSAIISAVDPVAVIGIFQDLHVNNPLYFIVFGEALFNDAVVVSFHYVIQDKLGAPSDSITILADISLGFFAVTGIGVGIGILFGLLTALTTRVFRESKTMEPLLVLSAAYLSYIMTEFLGGSAIVALTFFGFMQTAYIKYNLLESSIVALEDVLNRIAVTAELLIFFLMGLDSMKTNYSVDVGFILFTLLLIILSRVITVFGITTVLNVFRENNPISSSEKFVVAFAGLRGAIAFSLVHTLDADIVTSLDMFKTTTLLIILYTTFVFGISTPSLLEWLHVKREDPLDKTRFGSVTKHVASFVTPVMESIAGLPQTAFIQSLERFNDKYIRRWVVAGGMETVRQRNEEQNMGRNVGKLSEIIFPEPSPVSSQVSCIFSPRSLGRRTASLGSERLSKRTPNFSFIMKAPTRHRKNTL